VGNAERLQPHIEDDKAYVDEALEQARTALLWLDKQPDPKRIQALFWMNDSLSPHQRAIYRSEFEENPSITLFRWLAEKKADTMPDNTEEEQRAKKDQEAEDKHRLLNFLQSHNAYLADRQQSPEFVEAVNQQKKLFTQGIKKGLSEGWFHDSAKEALARVGGFRVYLGDFFTTDFSHRGGYYIIGDKNQVSVGEGAVEHATVHELNHALLETFPNPEDTRKPFNQTWLLEAVTEELAQTFKGGEFGEFNTNVGSYPEYRGLLRTVVDIARQLRTGVDFSDFTRAYSAPIEEQDEMVRQIADAFYDSGYPNYSIFADVESVMEQRLKDINSDPDTSRLPFRAKQNLAAKQTAGNLRSVARSLVDKNDQEVATS
jgi:aromatic ring-cleaving dioxygenase